MTPGLQHSRLPCPSPTPGACSNLCPLSRWCHPTISSSVIPFPSCLQSFPASGFFPMSQFFTSGGQTIAVSASASVLPINIQDWFPLGWTSWISLQSKRLSRVFSNTTVQKDQFFGAQLYGHCTTPMISLHFTQTFVNSPFVKPSSNYLVWACHLLLMQNLTDTPATRVSLLQALHHSWFF